MTHASKKTTIFILIAIFVVTMCFSLLAFSKNLYADTGYGEGYSEWFESGTDTGVGDPGSWYSGGTSIWGVPDTDAWGSNTWYYEQTVYADNYYESYNENSWWWYQTGVLPSDSYSNEWDNTWTDVGTYIDWDDVEQSYDRTIRDAGWDRFDVPVPAVAPAEAVPAVAPAECLLS